MKINRSLAAVAALGGAASVALGAFAAHGASPAVKALLTTGAQYLALHSLFALICAAWPGRHRLIGPAGWLALAGGLIFAVALSSIGLLGLSVMGAVAPVGGILMIAAWLLLAYAALRSHDPRA